jgi:alginate O-acetyltransferase complex protein AlgI
MPNRSIAVLLLASYAFYWGIAGKYIACLIFITLFTWYCGKQICQHPEYKKRYLIIGIAGTIGQLSLFKFAGFVHAIPLGLSFYSLASITYIFDLYRNKSGMARSIWDYALFVSFFPLITSGPIARAREFLPQLSALALRSEDLRYGVTLIAIGLIKKLAIADNIGNRIDPILLGPESHDSAAIVVAVLAFGIQLYLDFSGYSDIAIGSARIMGIQIPPNFINPYLSSSPSEFWHRWNISLSTFLRDFFYIPLGGNRKGNTRTCLNLLATMILCGLWHGAAWNFIIWGAYHGGLLAAQRIIADVLGERFTNRIWTMIKVIITQYLIFLGWIFFRISDLGDLAYCLKKFIFVDVSAILQSDNAIFAAVILIILLCRDRALSVDRAKRISSSRLRYWLIFLVIAMLLVIIIAPGTYPTFIYQAF